MTTHLLLGQIDTAATPASAAAELYVLSEGYGAAAGTDAPLLVESVDVAPAGQSGLTTLRRVYVPIEYGAACSVKVTPITDFNEELNPRTVAYASPATRTRDVIEVPVAASVTVVRVRVEVITRAGYLEVYTPNVGHVPRVSAAPIVVGATG